MTDRTGEFTVPEPSADSSNASAEMLASVNEVARGFGNALLAFVSLTLYIGIIVASTTDEKLVREEIVTLPLLNTPISIVGFYTLAPVILLAYHIYLVVFLNTLARRVRPLRRVLGAAPVAHDLSSFERLVTLPYVRLLAYPERIGWLERVSLYLPLAIVPMTTLLWLQYRFIAYRDSWPTTWIQILTIAAESLLLLYWLPHRLLQRHFIRAMEAPDKVPRFQGSFAALGSLCLLAGGFGAFTRFYPYTRPLPHSIQPKALEQVVTTVRHKIGSLHLSRILLARNALEARTVNELRGRSSPFIGSDNSAMNSILGAHMQGRDLRSADFYEAVLPRIDLRARSRDSLADVYDAVCQPVPTEHPPATPEASQRCRTRLEDVNLSWALLDEALLNEALLHRSDLSYAFLRGANLENADLTNANLQGAQLQDAKLRGTRLDFACLTGVNLVNADLQNASFACADLRGAHLSASPTLARASFPGALLDATLQQILQSQGIRPKDLIDGNNRCNKRQVCP